MNPVLSNMIEAGQAKPQSDPFYFLNRFFSLNFMLELLPIYPDLGTGTLALPGGLKRLSGSGPFPWPNLVEVKTNAKRLLCHPERCAVPSAAIDIKKPQENCSSWGNRKARVITPWCAEAKFKSIFSCFGVINPISTSFLP